MQTFALESQKLIDLGDGHIDLDLNSKLARRLSKIVPTSQETAASAIPTKIPERRTWAIKLNIVT